MMLEATGKTITIREPDGSVAYRKVNPGTIGKIPIITRLAEDGRLSDGKPMWVMPARPPLSFLFRSLDMSINEWKRTLRTQDLIDMLQHTEYKDDINIILYGEKR